MLLHVPWKTGHKRRFLLFSFSLRSHCIFRRYVPFSFDTNTFFLAFLAFSSLCPGFLFFFFHFSAPTVCGTVFFPSFSDHTSTPVSHRCSLPCRIEYGNWNGSIKIIAPKANNNTHKKKLRLVAAAKKLRPVCTLRASATLAVSEHVRNA